VLSQDELVSGVSDDGNPWVRCFLAPSSDPSALLPDWFAARPGCVGAACAFAFVSTAGGCADAADTAIRQPTIAASEFCNLMDISHT
jgi:hypothetical protein